MKNKAFFILLVTCLTGCFAKQYEKTGLEGKSMASFNLLLMDSTTKFNTSNIPTGKPTVFLFISPYCPYCKAQTEDILANMKSLQGIQFYILTSFPFLSIKEYANYYHLDKYPNVTVAQNYDNHFVDYFKVTSIPYMAIYNKNKVLEQVRIGKVEVGQIREIAMK